MTDSPGYAEKKKKYPNFFKEARNLTLMVCADGVNPWKNTDKNDSFFFVVIAVLNLPPEIRMKRENLILYGIVDAKPKDSHLVYNLLVNELMTMWGGVTCWDASKDERFTLRAMMLVGLFDYPGLCDACLQSNEGAIAGCIKCTLTGGYVRALRDVKYAECLHEGTGITLKRYTHDVLVDLGTRAEVFLHFP